MISLFACRDNVFLLLCGSIKLWEDTDSVKKVQDLLLVLLLIIIPIALCFFDPDLMIRLVAQRSMACL